MLAGNVAALLSPVLISPTLTYLFGPQNYDYATMRAIRKVDDSDVAAAAHVDIELIPGEAPSPTSSPDEDHRMNQAAVYSRALTIAMVLCFLLLWPIPMYGSSYVFSKKFFTGWVVVGLIWLFGTTGGVVVFPLWEGRASIARTARLMWLDLMGRRVHALEGRGEKDGSMEGSEGQVTPTEKVSGKV